MIGAFTLIEPIYFKLLKELNLYNIQMYASCMFIRLKLIKIYLDYAY